MEALTVRDQRGLLDCLREIHAERDAERFPMVLLASLARVIPSTYSVFQEIDLPDVSLGRVVQWPGELVQPWETGYFEAHVRRDHPVPSHYARSPRSGARRLSDFLTQRQYHRTGLYAECYRRLGVEHQMMTTMMRRLPIFVIMNRDMPDFSTRERRLLDLVRPHAEVALRNAEAFSGVRRRLHEAERALDASERGLVVVDGRGRVRMRSDRARIWEHGWFGRPRPANRLAGSLGAWMSACLPRVVRSDGAEPPTPLVVQRGTERMVVRLLPDPTRGEHVVLMEVQRLVPADGALDALGLSRRETDVLQWVALGKTNAEIAGILGVSARTVQKHLEHVFDKLGVETRTAAARRAWQPTSAEPGAVQ